MTFVLVKSGWKVRDGEDNKVGLKISESYVKT